MHVAIVVPTYNERPNLAALVAQLRDVCDALPGPASIVVVDDSSPDGTADVVRALQRDDTALHLLVGRKAGLGRAHLRGIRYALDVLDADIVVQMDADFSHRPEDVPGLVAALDGADFVIGSRYVPGGRLPPRWSALRRANSRCGNRLARGVRVLRDVADCTAGFRAIRAQLLRRIDLDALGVRGFALTVALLHEARASGATVREVPVEYALRRGGHSKLGIADIVEFVFRVVRLRLRNAWTAP